MFFENGTVAYGSGGVKIAEASMTEKLGEELLQRVINWALHYMSGIEVPKKRGGFVELRRGVMNLSIIGRACSQEERLEFYEMDRQRGWRAAMVESFNAEFRQQGVECSLGGQISIDCFPCNWDKRYCLQYLTQFDEIYFFGDRIYAGGNDFEVATDPRVRWYHQSSGPDDTVAKVKELMAEWR
eukprot:Polyplicarium_translucidae@DN3369_c0_g1_i25.p5